MNRLIFLAIFLLFFTNVALAQSKKLATDVEANRLSDDIVHVLGTEKQADALTYLENNLQDSSTEFGLLVDKFTAFLEKAQQKYGKVLGSDFAKKEAVGNYLVRYTYAILHEQKPVWVRLTYYKGAEDAFLLKKFDWGEDLTTFF